MKQKTIGTWVVLLVVIGLLGLAILWFVGPNMSNL